MKRIDITGPISDDMWQYGHPFPIVGVKEEKGYTEGFGDFAFTAVPGFHSLTGTYLETPAHFKGYSESFLIDSVPVEKLMDIDCVILNVDIDVNSEEKQCITLDMLKSCEGAKHIKKGDAILVGTGWGDEKWFSQDNFRLSPYFAKDAFDFLLENEPTLIGSDTSCWDNLGNPSGLFNDFYEKGILMLAELRNLKKVPVSRAKLTVLPLLLCNSCAAPCRAVLSYE